LLPTEQYKPGASLPPHLSPFTDDAKKGYIPEYRKELDSLVQAEYGVTPGTLEQKTHLDVEADEPEEESDEEQRYTRELEAEKQAESEQQTTTTPELPSSKKRKRARDVEQEEAEDQKIVAESLLPRRKRKLLQHIKYGQRMRREEIDKLAQKRKKFKSGKAIITTDSTVVYQ